MKKMILRSAMLFLLAGMTNGVTAQTTDHSVEKDNTKNQVMFQLVKGDYKYYNTSDVMSIDFEGYEITVKHRDGDDVYPYNVQNIAFLKGEKPAPTKADLIGTWEVRGHDEDGEDMITYTFTEDKLTITTWNRIQGHDPMHEVLSYTLKDGILSYTYPATEWSESYTDNRFVSLMYDKSVMVLKYKPDDWSWMFEEDEGLEKAEVFIKKDKNPDTSEAKLDGKWFCYHSGTKAEVQSGLWINGNKAEFVIGAWATRMVGPYTYENGVLYLHPTEYYVGRSDDEWGYGRIDPATLECSSWEKVGANPGIVRGGAPYPETFMFIINGDEAYSWYANLPCLYFKQ
jgi:hypothetical protein